MRRRTLLGTLGAAAGLPLLVSCGGESPPPPTIADVNLKATSDVNPDGTGAAKPLRVRVLRLTNTQALSQADFFALDANPQRALGPELVGLDEFVLAPGASMPYQHEFEPTAKFVGVVGSYFAIDSAQWRAWQPVPPHATTPYTATFGPSGVQLAQEAA